MPYEYLRPGFPFTEERVERLKDVVPEAFADGKINWSTLREALGNWLEDSGDEAEHFGLTWPGKREARRAAATPSQGTLIPVPGDGVDEENTRNQFIEGDNLEVLKLLQKSYAGRVKMIYIDPPYNTGSDFVYEDDFAEPLETYLRRTGQLDSQGMSLTTNTRADGRFHSRWLSMMYPRLRLASTLLREDGIIFVSIDDNEVNHLRLILNEIFGEECFLACIVWQKRTSPDARLNLGPAHDYILAYAKADPPGAASLRKLALSEERTRAYQNPDNDKRGPWASVDLTGQTGHATASQYYTIVTPAGEKYSPPEGRCWALSESTFLELRSDGRIWFGKDGTSRPRLKKFLAETEGTTVWTWWPHTEVGSNQDGTKEIITLLGQGDIFTNPKPTRLLSRLIALATSGDSQDVCLDFFAGAGSLAHAVMLANRADGGTRQSISVQLPEPTPKASPARNAGYATLADIGKERLRRAIRIMRDAGKPAANEDLGFRVLRLARSNYRVWKDYDGDNPRQIIELFARTEEPLIEGWTPDGLLTEVMLLEGFPLDSRIRPLAAHNKNKVLAVTSDFIAHRLFVCLDARLYPDTANTLAIGEGDVFVCLDSALTDEMKIRLADRCLLKTI